MISVSTTLHLCTAEQTSRFSKIRASSSLHFIYCTWAPECFSQKVGLSLSLENFSKKKIGLWAYLVLFWSLAHVCPKSESHFTPDTLPTPPVPELSWVRTYKRPKSNFSFLPCGKIRALPRFLISAFPHVSNAVYNTEKEAFILFLLFSSLSAGLGVKNEGLNREQQVGFGFQSSSSSSDLLFFAFWWVCILGPQK